jgi:hypothetical protein
MKRDEPIDRWTFGGMVQNIWTSLKASGMGGICCAFVSCYQCMKKVMCNITWEHDQLKLLLQTVTQKRIIEVLLFRVVQNTTCLRV